jgi:hypothetical protein
LILTVTRDRPHAHRPRARIVPAASPRGRSGSPHRTRSLVLSGQLSDPDAKTPNTICPQALAHAGGHCAFPSKAQAPDNKLFRAEVCCAKPRLNSQDCTRSGSAIQSETHARDYHQGFGRFYDVKSLIFIQPEYAITIFIEYLLVMTQRSCQRFNGTHSSLHLYMVHCIVQFSPAFYTSFQCTIRPISMGRGPAPKATAHVPGEIQKGAFVRNGSPIKSSGTQTGR